MAENLRKLVPVLDVEDVTHRPDRRRATWPWCACAARPASARRWPDLVAIFRGKIVDVGAGLGDRRGHGRREKVDGLVDLLRERGILEMVRTGKVALVRGSTDVKTRATDADQRRQTATALNRTA